MGIFVQVILEVRAMTGCTVAGLRDSMTAGISPGTADQLTIVIHVVVTPETCEVTTNVILVMGNSMDISSSLSMTVVTVKGSRCTIDISQYVSMGVDAGMDGFKSVNAYRIGMAAGTA